jgi:hypothetical protein
MSRIKKDKKSGKGRLPGKPSKMILTRDHTGKLVEGRKVTTVGIRAETPRLVEIVPKYTECTNCHMFLGAKETDLAGELDYNCIECFELQIEEEFSSNSIMITPLEVSKNKRRKK